MTVPVTVAVGSGAPLRGADLNTGHSSLPTGIPGRPTRSAFGRVARQRPSVTRRPKKKQKKKNMEEEEGVNAEVRGSGSDDAMPTVEDNATREPLSSASVVVVVTEEDSVGMGFRARGRAATGGRGGEGGGVGGAVGCGFGKGDGGATGEDEKPFCLRILLAEDSIPNQKLMSRILERAGHTVEAVRSCGCFLYIRRAKFLSAAGAKSQGNAFWTVKREEEEKEEKKTQAPGC